MKNKKGVIYKRKQEILRELHENKKVLVDDLAKALHVSPITIRRDLDEFQAEGIVERFYGGASLVEGALAEDPSEQDSSDQNQSCKESIAREAAALVTEGDTIFLNSSSTALLLLKYLKGKRVTVITNNGNALHMETDPLIELVLTGGEVNQYKKSMVGDFALQMLRKLRADKCFIGVSGINELGEITTAVLQETMINSLMIEQIKGMRVILADHTKIGSQNNFVIASLNQITHLITDEKADPRILSALKRQNVSILTAPLETKE